MPISAMGTSLRFDIVTPACPHEDLFALSLTITLKESENEIISRILDPRTAHFWTLVSLVYMKSFFPLVYFIKVFPSSCFVY